MIVTEPGRGALHDLERLRRLFAHFRIGAMVVLNRCDTDRNLARQTERYCVGHALPLAGSIPFHPAFIDAAVAGRPAVEDAEAGWPPACGRSTGASGRRSPGVRKTDEAA